MFVEIFFGGFFVFVFLNKRDSDFDKARDMHGFILVEGFEGFFDFFSRDFGVTVEGFFETVEVEIFDIFLGVGDDFFHVFSYFLVNYYAYFYYRR